ncbi:low molecular weight phosphotyrosine protein phosphatase [Xanthomonas sp. A2111]|uniref:protein-tyrosine-phosphatase n=1 Tax=Xanthomonas hawaiiensis TaxID=3003247 RepID=A0ABU2I1D7_9XANT|nr:MULTISPECIES: low molecular weight protein-tyrosine-phosphatase [unclassified Xanthomonas]MBO9827944.1 low molecular weight phosphotyrosine protein phosphatase [Xanthomonas sp. A2111]MBO9875689.1 low molecular weight phosphotyrosine protein phosphatase [Xanthomonas sp. D-93]MDS9991542.1 low molecular weight phosphotyrosine protein phosphatase [Xanthomonas sp. A2111]WNH43366.1 low molecular weight phosphotyrosine protein phosphatase [Xanthomonas sp. A6251]
MKLLLVCLGNICRSPMAEGALRHHLQRSPLAGVVEVDSAGTGDWHRGEPPDRRAIACAAAHDVDIAGLRARQLRDRDFAEFDWLLCADAANLRDVLQRAPASARERVALWLPWAGVHGRSEIPDPYTGGSAQFEQVWQLVDEAAAGSVARLSADLGSGIIDR